MKYKNERETIYDIHYGEEEYIKFNTNIVDSIISNFEKNKLFIEFDKILKEYNDTENISEDIIINSIDELIFVKYKNLINSEILKSLLKYYIQRYSYDFFYTPREQIINFIKNKL